MNRFFGILGILFILGMAYLLSNNKKAINWRVVISGLVIQLGLAIFVLKVPLGQWLFREIGQGITKLLDFANMGSAFVFGFLADQHTLDRVLYPVSGSLFFMKLIPSVIFVAVLVSIAYHFGIMQRVVAVIAKIVHKLMGVSGSEALSNVGSAFVGQVEAQILIKPYVMGMTMSELLASMTGSMACIAGGVMAVYISMGIPAQYLLAASIMAAPGALVISKMVYPETENSETQGQVKIDIKKTHVNVIDAISHGASDGMKISINVIAMLIGLIALIAMIDAAVGFTGSKLVAMGAPAHMLGMNLQHLSIKDLMGTLFSAIAWLMGVPWHDAHFVGSLMGTKLVFNEFLAYSDLSQVMSGHSVFHIARKSMIISSFALCGFANLSSIAIQVGGIGELAPSRRADLAKLGFKALICGTMASYLSATIAGILV